MSKMMPMCRKFMDKGAEPGDKRRRFLAPVDSSEHSLPKLPAKGTMGTM